MRKTAIVTGGTSGIGLGIVKKLANNDYNLVIFANDAHEALERLDRQGIPYIYIQGDLANLEDHKKLLEAAVESFGRIDLLVNNAGVISLYRDDLMLLGPESFDYVMNINLRGTFFLTQKVAAHMISQEEIDGYRGVIINVESSNSTVVSLNRGEYCMSKAGLSMMTQLFAARLGKESIFVYGIRPGVIATQNTLKSKEKFDAIVSGDDVIIKRWGQPEDCAEAVWALCSNDLRYCAGTVINVDGGLIQRRVL
jgi:NAD(P)-dependent dehydrogenase (short-subunit alcohol dehydrogenase family)